MLTIFILIAAGFTFCHASPLLSKHLWNEVTNYLMPKDDKKFGMVQVEFQSIRAYENIKEKFYPENNLPWGFFKHLETGNVIIENDSGVLPWNKEMRYSQNIWDYTKPHSQMKPFIRCMANCFDLTDMLSNAFVNNAFVNNHRTDHDGFPLIDLIKSLVHANVKLNEDVKYLVDKEDRYKITPLANAYKHGNEDYAHILIQLGANVNSKGERGATILHETAICKWGEPQKKILKMLIEAGAHTEAKTSAGFTPLSMIAHFTPGRPEIARILIAAKANIEAKDNEGNTALHSANSKEIAEVLLEAGADTEAKNNFEETPFDIAMTKRDVETAREIFKASEHKDATNRIGQSALHISVLSMSELGFAKMLIEEGVGIDAKDDMKQTALLCSVLFSKTNFVRMLIEEGADTNIKDNSGQTALHHASNGLTRNGPELVQMLIQAGANTNLKDNSGRTSLDIALSWNAKEVVQIFLKHTSIDYGQALQVALKNRNVSLGIILFVAAAKKYSKLFLLISFIVCIFSIFLKLN